MSFRTAISSKFPESATARINGTIEDEAGVGFKPSTLVLTLYDLESDIIINSRNAQNVLDQNGVVVASNGGLVWTVSPLDMIILDSTKDEETHIALFEWTWASGVKAGAYEIEIVVKNMHRRT